MRPCFSCCAISPTSRRLRVGRRVGPMIHVMRSVLERTVLRPADTNTPLTRVVVDFSSFHPFTDWMYFTTEAFLREVSCWREGVMKMLSQTGCSHSDALFLLYTVQLIHRQFISHLCVFYDTNSVWLDVIVHLTVSLQRASLRKTSPSWNSLWLQFLKTPVS